VHPSMIREDVTANLAMLALDVGMVVFIARRKTDKRNFALLALLTPLFSAPFLPSGIVMMGLDSYGFLGPRYLGQALFWHVPLLCGVFAFLLREDFRRFAIGLLLSAVGLLGVYVYAYHYEPQNLEVTHYDFRHPRLAGLERPITIAQFSDPQSERFGAYEKRVLRTLSALKPDLILCTGDYIQVAKAPYSQSAAQWRQGFLEAGIDPPLGGIAVQGDCEGGDGWNAIFEGLSIQPVSNFARILELPGCRINLIGLGLGASRTRNPKSLERLPGERAPEALDIYVGHAPDFALALEHGERPFLAIAGHTHGGQVQLPGFGPLITLTRVSREHADGFLPLGVGTLSVSRGIGMERLDAPQLRFLCRPELRIITLHPWEEPAP
jgi:uncharacterized protein